MPVRQARLRRTAVDEPAAPAPTSPAIESRLPRTPSDGPHGQMLGDVDISTLSDSPARLPPVRAGVVLGANRRPVRQPACRVCRGYCTRGDQGTEKGSPASVTTSRDWGVPAKGSLTGTPCLLPGGSSLMVMESWNEIRTFLASRRAMITSEQAGVATFGEMRRVPSLRRSCTVPSPWAGRRSRSTGRCPAPGEIDTCSASAMNDSWQLGSAVPELRSTWRTRSSCSTAGSCWPTSMTSSAATDGFDRGGVPEAAAGRRTGRTRSASAPVSIMSASVHPAASSTEPFEQLKGRI